MYNDQGKLDFVKGRYDRAIEQYDLAVYFDPAFAGAYYNRGVAYEAKGNRIRAQEDFDKAYSLGFSRLGGSQNP